MKKRTKIPTGRADAILFDSDMSCCICRIQSKSLQLHHIDGNPSNHINQNIAVLCHDHHSQATSTPGLGRGLSNGIIKKYRDEWWRHVAVRRERKSKKRTLNKRNSISHDALLNALASHEIRKIRSSLLPLDWAETASTLGRLYMYTDGEYGYEVRSELLYTLALLGERTRDRMPASVARAIESLAFSALPITSLVEKSTHSIDRNTKKLLRSALNLGFAITHDGIKYLQDLSVTAAGSRLLFLVLRYAHLNNISDLKKTTLGEFSRLEQEAKRRSFSDALRWLEFERLDALALDGDTLPEMPIDLEKKISI